MAASTPGTLLALSLKGLFSALLCDAVWDADLANAVFYLGCPREHALSELRLVADDLRGNQVRQALAHALRAAAREGRVEWRDPDSDCTFEELNWLLARNGLPPINPPGNCYGYDPYAVYRAVGSGNLPYRVVVPGG